MRHDVCCSTDVSLCPFFSLLIYQLIEWPINRWILIPLIGNRHSPSLPPLKLCPLVGAPASLLIYQLGNASWCLMWYWCIHISVSYFRYIKGLINQSRGEYWCMRFKIDKARPRHCQFVSVNGFLRVSVYRLFRWSTNEKVDTYFTRQWASVETSIRLPSALSRNQWGHQQSAMSIQKFSVVKSTDPTATKWWHSYDWWEWFVSFKVRSVSSVGRVGCGLQEKGCLVANMSQKVSQIPFFEYPKTKSTAGFSNSICFTPNYNNPTPLITDTVLLMGDTPAAVVI